MASKSVKKMGKKGLGAKPPKANALAGTSNYVAKAAGFKTGGVIGGASQAPFGGPSAVKRLDRPGRKRGGSVGADSHPLTSAANLSGSE